MQDCAIFEGGGDVELSGGVVLRRVGGHAIPEGDGVRGGDGFDFDGSGIFEVEGPCGDIDVVCAPVCHFSTGVFVPPAEFVVAA